VPIRSVNASSLAQTGWFQENYYMTAMNPAGGVGYRFDAHTALPQRLQVGIATWPVSRWVIKTASIERE
jgi:hypothetical protein